MDINGTDAAVVVALSEGPRTCSERIQLPSISVLYTASCDMGVKADISTEYTEFRRRMIAQSSEEVGPFAVVSVAPGAVAEDNPESCHGALPAIDFISKKLKGRSALTYREIKQIAVCALKHLLVPKFDPNMIQLMCSGILGIGEAHGSNFRVCALEVQKLFAAMNLT